MNSARTSAICIQSHRESKGVCHRPHRGEAKAPQSIQRAGRASEGVIVVASGSNSGGWEGRLEAGDYSIVFGPTDCRRNGPREQRQVGPGATRPAVEKRHRPPIAAFLVLWLL